MVRSASPGAASGAGAAVDDRPRLASTTTEGDHRAEAITSAEATRAGRSTRTASPRRAATTTTRRAAPPPRQRARPPRPRRPPPRRGGATTTAAGGATTTAAAAAAGGVSPACEPDDSIDAVEGKNAGQFTADLQCAVEKPLKAEGEPDRHRPAEPAGRPERQLPRVHRRHRGGRAKYINEELGGLGSNPSEGRAGRPIQLETCFMAINPADSQKCANELAGKDPFAVISTLNFFGNHFPIYEQAGINVVVGTPITVGDFTAPGVYSIGAGGGCLGVHTGLVFAATQELEGKRVAVPWADTPPGVVCYYDLEKKPLDVLQGSVPGDSRAGRRRSPTSSTSACRSSRRRPDVTPQVTQVLDFDPDVIIFSAQGADCWNFVDGLGRAGWTPDRIPLILSGACIDFEKMKAAGDLANGVYFVGAAGASLADPDDDRRTRGSSSRPRPTRRRPPSTACPTPTSPRASAVQGWSRHDDHLGAGQHRRQRAARSSRPRPSRRRCRAPRTTTSTARCPSGAPTPRRPTRRCATPRSPCSQWDGTALKDRHARLLRHRPHRRDRIEARTLAHRVSRGLGWSGIRSLHPRHDHQPPTKPMGDA